ncbi:MAG: hypothetical protein JW925_14385 [Syntrophaceae bacterium]|nr:hypothetical protein [Syntrophaceae bacterium]
MATVNVVIGLGGTGKDILEFFAKTLNDYPIKENAVEVFLFDTKRYSPGDPLVKELQNNKWKTEHYTQNRIFELETFNDSQAVVEKIKSKTDVTNIGQIFLEKDPIIIERAGTSGGGAWYKRKLGYLSIFYHLYLNSSDNGVTRIVDTLNSYNDTAAYNRFNIFIVNSLAGGTGSGMFIPLAALLRSELSKNLGGGALHFYSILIAPDALEKRDRSVDDTTSKIFRFNAAQILKELGHLNPSQIEWDVKFYADHSFVLQPGQRIFNNIFIVTDSNTSTTATPLNSKEYKPYFLMSAWAVYTFCASNDAAWGQMGNPLQAAGNSISGFGLRVFEFPSRELAEQYTLEIIDRFRLIFRSLVLINMEEAKRGAEAFFEESIKAKLNSYFTEKDEKVKKKRKKFENELNEVNSKNIDQLKELTISILDYNEKGTDKEKTPAEQLKATIFPLLDNTVLELIENEQLGFPIEFLRRVNQKIEDRKKELDNDNKEKDQWIGTRESDIKGLKKANKIRASKNKLYDKMQWKAKNIHEQTILSDIQSAIKNRWDYLSGIYDQFINTDSKWSLPNFRRQSFDPPQTKVIGSGGIKTILEDIKDEIRTNLLSHEYSGTSRERQEDADKELIKAVWSFFERMFLKENVIQSYDEKMKGRKKWNEPKEDTKQREDILKVFTETYVLKYLLENHHEFNNPQKLIEAIHKKMKQYLPHTYPFLSLVADRDERSKGTPFIFASSEHTNSIDRETITGFETAQIFDTPLDDNLIICLRLLDSMSFDNLDLADYNENYKWGLRYLKNEYKKIDEKRREDGGEGIYDKADFDLLKFIDPRFDVKLNEKQE